MSKVNKTVSKGQKAANLKTKGGPIEKTMKMTKTPKMPKSPKGKA